MKTIKKKNWLLYAYVHKNNLISQTLYRVKFWNKNFEFNERVTLFVKMYKIAQRSSVNLESRRRRRLPIYI